MIIWDVNPELENRAEADNPNGWALNLHWDANLSDGEYTARPRYGSVSMPDQETGGKFTDLEAMGEAAGKVRALEWVKEQLGAEYVAEVEAALAADIAEQKAPSTRAPAWA